MHDYSAGPYPRDPRTCETCHVEDSYGVPLPEGALPTVSPAADIPVMAPITATCLSCHDGAVALGDVAGEQRPITMQGAQYLTPGRSGYIGTDLSGSHLLHVGIKGYAPVSEGTPARNLVFLLDVSGSMQAANKLELLKKSLRLLVNQLQAQDRVAIVVYAGASGAVVRSTPGTTRSQLLNSKRRAAGRG